MVDYNRTPRRHAGAGLDTPTSIHRRRAEAARARQRRLLLSDLALGLLLALAAVILAPGLAIVAIGALLVLFAYGLAMVVGRVRERRAARRYTPR